MENRQHKLLWSSSYDRGLQYLLYMWPDIKQKYPDATLDVAYGWDLFDKAFGNNPERMQWRDSINTLMQQDGITHHGRIGKKELSDIRKTCGIWPYTAVFTEINCITALEAQSDGLVPVVMNFKSETDGELVYTALDETVGSGIKVEGDIKDMETQKVYLAELLKVMGDEKLWLKESKKAIEFAKSYDWDKISDKWIEVFKEEASTPKVSVITPTIRTGWWNIMAENLSKQSYKNIEWLIIDDYKEDRSEIAKKYASLYNLDIHYIRGDKGSGSALYPRKCGLVRANNLGWQNATGELCVWLQDFILLPETGIERLVTLHQHNPKAIIAPVDKYYQAKPADRTNSEDWWNGDTNIITEDGWTNPRVKNEGIRTSDNPFDYEANYGAIPRELLVKLNGFYEFYDEGLGFDNVDLSSRALELGYKLIIDDTNICKCINIWPEVKGTDENVLNRERMANPPRYAWAVREMKAGRLPVVRDIKLDESIKLDYTIPAEVEDKYMAKWVDKNIDKIVDTWKPIK